MFHLQRVLVKKRDPALQTRFCDIIQVRALTSAVGLFPSHVIACLRLTVISATGCWRAVCAHGIWASWHPTAAARLWLVSSPVQPSPAQVSSLSTIPSFEALSDVLASTSIVFVETALRYSLLLPCRFGHGPAGVGRRVSAALTYGWRYVEVSHLQTFFTLNSIEFPLTP